MYLTRHQTAAGPRWALDGVTARGVFAGPAPGSTCRRRTRAAGRAAEGRAGRRSPASAGRAGTRSVGRRGYLPAQQGRAQGGIERRGRVPEGLRRGAPGGVLKGNGWRVIPKRAARPHPGGQPVERARAGNGAGHQPGRRDRGLLRGERCRRATSRAITRSTCRRRKSTTGRARSGVGFSWPGPASSGTCPSRSRSSGRANGYSLARQRPRRCAAGRPSSRPGSSGS